MIGLSGIFLALTGLVNIIMQIFVPDIVPDFINKAIDAAPAEQFGYVGLLKFTLVLWQIWGIVGLIGGGIATFIGY